MGINDRKSRALRQVADLRQLHERSRPRPQHHGRYVEQELVGKTALQKGTCKRRSRLDQYFIDLNLCKALEHLLQIQSGAGKLLDFGAARFERPCGAPIRREH